VLPFGADEMQRDEITSEPATGTDNVPTVLSRRADDDATLITWLADRDAACPLCEYNLRGLTTPPCPECGQALRLSVTLAEPYLKAWIAVIVALLPPAGVGVVFVLALLVEGFHGGNIEWGPALAIIYVIGCIPLSAVALANRQKFLRLKRGNQQWIATVVWIACLAAFVYMVSQMR
jgi:hypothetical protein